jgi:hypothetical protein
MTRETGYDRTLMIYEPLIRVGIFTAVMLAMALW